MDPCRQARSGSARKPRDVEDLVPSANSLRVDGALLTSAELVAILKGDAGVQASSSLLLNLAQQLIAANLNILRGVQASTECCRPS